MKSAVFFQQSFEDPRKVKKVILGSGWENATLSIRIVRKDYFFVYRPIWALLVCDPIFLPVTSSMELREGLNLKNVEKKNDSKAEKIVKWSTEVQERRIENDG